MAIGNQHYDVLGVSVGHVGPIEHSVHVELSQGVRALYGLNGAGKTWLLRAIEAALTGVRLDAGERARDPRAKLMTLPVAHVHLRLTDPNDDDVFRCTLTGALYDGLRSVLDAERGRQLADTEVDTGDLFNADEDALEDAWLSELAIRYVRLRALRFGWSSDAVDRLVEACDEGYYTLVATGTSTQPAWEVWMSSMFDHEQRQSVADIGAFDDDTYTYPLGLAIGHDYVKRLHNDRQRVPTWLPFPVLPLGCKISVPAVEVIHGNGASMGDALQLTLAQRPQDSAPAVDTNGAVAADIRDELTRIGNRAHTDMHEIFPGTDLRFHVGDATDWLHGRVPSWVYRDGSSERELPIESLSDTQYRWATMVTGVAEMRSADVPMIFLCDEPERGLHLSVERRLPGTLSRISSREGMSVVVATHSHYMLAHPAVEVARVDRSYGTTALLPTTLSVVDSVARRRTQAELGLSAAELNTLMNVAVVVEGLHDEIVFSGLIRECLDRSSAGVFPMHGGTGAQSLAEARLLIDGTDVEILVVLDNLDQKRVAPIWQLAKDRAAVGAVDDARTALAELRMGGKNSERKYLHQLGDVALATGCFDRLHIVGLTRPDVICYIPEAAIFPPRKKPPQWEPLVEKWRNHTDVTVSGRSIKGYLTSMSLFPRDDLARDRAVEDSVGNASREGLPVHPELLALGAKIEELAATYRSNTRRA